MTSNAQVQGRRRGFDLSWPTFALLTLILSVLVLLPLFWLTYYSFRSDTDGSATIENYIALFADPTLVRAYALAIGMALAVGLLACIIATPHSL